MSYDPTLPVNSSRIVAAELRNQFNGLKAIIGDLQAQLAPLVPVLARSDAGLWTVSYAGPAWNFWQVWARYEGSEPWSNTGELRATDFPVADAAVVPDGALWWQIKMCGEGDNGEATTPFSNIISYGPVPG